MVLVDEDAEDTNAMDVVGGATTAKPLPPLVSTQHRDVHLIHYCIVLSTVHGIT
jgi:hypothetical protein